MPYADAAKGPNIVIDGQRNDNTVINLSHWPKSGTPWPLKADTSVAVVFKYLDMPEWHCDVATVTNDHFDEDGLIGLFCMIEPEFALANRKLLIDSAQAGDFGFYSDRRAARIAFTISRLADPATSPWVGSVISENAFADYPGYCGAIYARLLDELKNIILEPEDYRDLWADEDALLEISEAALEEGVAMIEEIGDIDLAVVRVPADWPEQAAHRVTQHRDVVIHPMAVHNRTLCNRVLTLSGERADFEFRYESWVQMVSRKPPLRVDFHPLAETLNEIEGGEGRWSFDGVEEIVPKLRTEIGTTAIPHDQLLEVITTVMRDGEPAWDPYDVMS